MTTKNYAFNPESAAAAMRGTLRGHLFHARTTEGREAIALSYERDALTFEGMGTEFAEFAALYRKQAADLRTTPDHCCVDAVPGICRHDA